VQNKQLQHQLNNLEKISKHKKVTIDPNLLFAEVENIKYTIDYIAHDKAHWEAREPAVEARRTAIAVQKLRIKEMTVEWQLDL
jgi:hypothetical protein